MIVLDEQLQGLGLESAILDWYRGQVLVVKQLRPGTIIKDEVVPSLLRKVKQPTFVTINYSDFWQRVPADRKYCIVCITLTSERANEIPKLLRSLFSLSEFRTKASRMGKIVLVRRRRIEYYQQSDDQIHVIDWTD